MSTRAKEIRELGNTGYLEVDANGNVGIGTPSPTNPLHLYANNTSELSFKMEQQEGFFEIGTNGNTTIFRNANGYQMFLNSDGNLGIGTLNADYKLTVAGDPGNDAITLLSLVHTDTDFANGTGFNHAVNIEFNLPANRGGDTSPRTAALIRGRKGAADWWTGAADSTNFQGQLAFYTRQDNVLTEQMVIDEDGNVGIGTSTPNHALHVTGYKDDAGNGTDLITLALTSSSSSVGTNSANGPGSLAFKGWGWNYNGDGVASSGSNEISIELEPTWKYWGNDNTLSSYGQTMPVLDFNIKNSNDAASQMILRMMGYGKRLVGTQNTGSSDIPKQLTKGAINLFPQLGRYLGSIPNSSSNSIASMLGCTSGSSANTGVYLIAVNGSGNANARDTGIYMVSIGNAVDIYDGGMLVTEQFNNKGLCQVAAGFTAADHIFITVTTLMRGYDSCYGNCGSFNMDQYGNISTSGAYGGCAVWAIHLISNGKGGNTLWEG